MHFVIMGSGRVGAAMAIELDRQGHSVAVVDQNPAAFRKLKKDFSGQKVKGVDSIETRSSVQVSKTRMPSRQYLTGITPTFCLRGWLVKPSG